jgi:hypothetical protein
MIYDPEPCECAKAITPRQNLDRTVARVIVYGRDEQAVPLEPHMTAPEQSSAKGYDPLYAAFDSPTSSPRRS